MHNRQRDIRLTVSISLLFACFASLTGSAAAAAGPEDLPAIAKTAGSSPVEKLDDNVGTKGAIGAFEESNSSADPPVQPTATASHPAQSDAASNNSKQKDSDSADNESQPSPDENESQTTETGGTESGETKTDETEPADQTDESSESQRSWFSRVAYPIIVLAVGIATVLGLIIFMKINAFLALICSAIVVSIMAPGPLNEKIGRVATELGNSVGGIGIVIALAAIIGKCMLDSGAADRIVKMFMDLLGEKRAPVALMGSGFVLAVPVFFDTVFYLLVPLARSLHRKTGVRYLLYIMAIGAGGAITHTLVPPTPGPLLMASNLGVDIGTMMMIGMLVALPAAVAGLISGSVADRIMQTPMRELPGSPEPEPIDDDQLPSLWLSLAPVVIPVVLISMSTIVTFVADNEGAARFRAKDLDPDFASRTQAMAERRDGVARRLINHPAMQESTLAASATDKVEIAKGLNRLLRDKDFYDEDAFLGVKLNPVAKSLLDKDRVRMKRADTERMNRALLESAFPETIEAHQWNTTSRQVANFFGFFGNANFALLISTLIALWTLAVQRNLSFADLAKSTEEALMSGGIIILITAGGGAFGAMLSEAEIGDAIKELFSGSGSDGGMSGIGFLLLGFGISAILKIAQGSSTVAMIVGSSMVAAIVNGDNIGFHYVYLATAIGGGSLFGSWMNDSGFWIFAKMGGLTETEALKSWTIMLAVLSLVSLTMSIILALILPMSGASG